MTQARTKDYWISPSALHIELNALGNPDYIQASCMSGAQILVYVKDIIGFDAGHNYRRWPLQAAPTVFNTHTEKYVYAAIPRDMTLAASAWIVFPSEQIDIYGKNEKEEQIGDENYYYIFLQGIITSSGDNGTVQRDWKEGGRIVYGYLSSDEAISAIPYESEWYNYSSVDNIVTFLKDITMKVGTKFRQLFAKTLTIVSGGKIAFEDQGEVNGVATTDTQLESTDKIVTPKFLDDNALSKVKQDAAQEIIRFIKGLTLGENTGGNNFGISSDGIATLKEVVSAAFRSGALGSGFKLGDYNGGGDSYLEVDRLLVRKDAEFIKLVIRELQSVGGEIVLSDAAMKISKVDFLKKGTLLPEYGTYPLRYDVYRCSFLAKHDDKEIANKFVVNDLVRCQTFNIKEGTTANAKNKYYWRRVMLVGTDYIDILALSGGNYGDSQPEVGDELVQMGNTTDVARQSVLYLSAYGSDSPSIKLYKGVNDYTLDGKEIFVVSRDEIYALASMFKLKVKDGDTTKETTLAELVANVDGLTSTVSANKQEVDGQIGKINTTLTQNAESITSLAQKQTNTENKVSKIEQTTDKISLQVETTTNLKNSIVGSALRPWDDITKIAAAHSQKVEITSGGGVGGSNYATFSASGATADTYTGLYFKDVRVTAGKTYVFSVWAKIVSLLDNGAYYSIKRFDGGTEGAVVKSGNITLGIGGWKLFSSTFTVPDGCTKLLLELAVRRNGAISVCRPMIMEGTEYGGWSLSPYDKTEADKLESGLKRTGIDIEQNKIVFTSDNAVFRDNSGQEVAAFKDGAINADLVKVTQMETKAEGGATIKIHNGLLEVAGTIGKTNIRFGVNENGMAVMQYLDNAGNILYDLGPGGWDASRFSEAVVARIGVMPATEWLGTTNFTETKTYEVGNYSVKLPVATARAGRIVFGALDGIEQEGVLGETSVPASYKNFYQYTAARNNGKCMPDEDRGLTTEALAQQADGKYFTDDTILAENGSLKNLASGVYFFVGDKTEKTEAPSTGGKYPDRRLGYATFTNGKVLFSWVYSRTWRKV